MSSMKNLYTIKLDDFDLGQTVDGLRLRAEAWEKTAQYLRTNEMPPGEEFLAEECSDPDEAGHIAGRYRSIIGKIREQMEAQS
jgi:hypothetical protein